MVDGEGTAALPSPGMIDPQAARWRQAVRLLRGLLRGHRRTFAIAVGGASVYAACTVLSAFVIRLVADRIIQPRFVNGQVATGTVVGVLALLFAVALTRATGVVIRRVWAGRTAWGANATLSGEVIDRIVRQPVPWLRRQVPGDLISRASLDADAASSVLNPLPFASSVVVLLTIASAWMLATDLILGAVAVALFPVMLTLNVVYQHRVNRYFDAAQDTIGALSGAVHESFDGVAVVKSLGAERRETDRLSIIAARLRDERLQIVRLRSSFEALLEAIPNSANVLLLIVGAYRVRSGDISIGELASFFYLFTLLVFPLRLIGFALSELPHSLSGWNRIRSVVDQPIQSDPQAAVQRTADGSVRLDEVVYSHDGSRRVLDGVTATIEHGRTVAVVGATGAGKTTLLQLISGLIAADGGTVSTPPGETVVVFQEPFLMAGSVRDNIALGQPIDEAALAAAIDTAAAGFCFELPNGLDTLLGERGVGLSGGQRQRIALARALVRRPAVLLLDDTTSALDPATESVVLGNLRRDNAETTVIAVASRPSTIALADDVLFLVDGRVVAHGSHQQLMAGVDDYRRLIEAFEHDRMEQERDQPMETEEVST